MTDTTDYDLVIVGGGMVGASLANALSKSSLRIAMVEAVSAKSEQQPSYDDRGIALSYGSQRIFESLGLWDKLATQSTPIKNIHVSDRGHFGVTRLSARDEQVPALGQVITAKAIGSVLNDVIDTQENLNIISPAKVINLEQFDGYVELELDTQQKLSSQLLVAADGGQSTIRHLLGLGALERDYQQTAITANITPERAHQNWAYERFTDTGPIALLPMSDHRCSLVWTVKSGDDAALLDLSEQDFLKQLQDRFGYRLGKLTQVGQRNSYPLRLIQADQPVQHRAVLIGNAAHSLHPIAGQGFNLGLRDVAVLADLLASKTDDYGDPRLLLDYKQWRLNDQDNVISATNSLVALFSNNNPLLGHLRGAGLNLIETVPPLKHLLAKQSMGLNHRQPRLGRGISL